MSLAMNQNNAWPLMPAHNDEFQRLLGYPLDWTCGFQKADLAQQGFCFVSRNSVRCFCCGLNLHVQAQHEPVDLRSQHMNKSHQCPMTTNDLISSRNIPMVHNNIYKCERDRLYSFYVSVFTWPVDVHNLAKCGFYYDSNKKSSCCYICKLQIGSWTQGDTGESEHQKYNPQCSFYCNNPSAENIPLGLEDTDEAKKIIAAAILDASTVSIDLPMSTVIHEEPKHPRYKTAVDRVKSYSTWPASMKQRPGELSDAGFYYSSKGDLVICFQCGGGLRDWEISDQPWSQHATHFPLCPYVLAIKREDFVAKMRALKASSTSPSTIRALENPEAPDEEEVQIDMEMPLEGPMDEAGEVRLCKVCLNKDLGIVFLPCAHMATCPDCAPQMNACPICRSNFTAYVRAFLPM